MGIIGRSFVCWLLDPTSPNFTHPCTHVLSHAYACALAGMPFPCPPTNPVAAFKNIRGVYLWKHSRYCMLTLAPPLKSHRIL